ncbi:MAG TPA: tetratricopeptide repeat protein [bacterium]|nr:tetratricopeptide repeat protein [bacterium]
MGFAQTAAQYITAGNQSYAIKDYAKAVQYYQAAVQADPNSAAAYQGLGNSYYQQGQTSQALDAYEKALNLNPNNAQLSTFVQSLRAKVGSTSVPAASTAASPAASSMSTSSSSTSSFNLDIDAGIILDSSQVGFGGGLSGFVPLSKNFLLGAGGSFYTVSESQSDYGITASATVNFIEAMAKAKYLFDGDSMKPFGFAGAGINAVSGSGSASGGGATATASLGSQVDPMIAFGAGLQFAGGNKMNFEVQLKESIIFVPGVTVSAGSGAYSTTVTAGGGTESYTGIEGGINFDM